MPVENSRDPVLEEHGIEVHQKPERELHNAEVTDYLCLENREHLGHRLEFNDDASSGGVLHQQVNPEGGLHPISTVDQIHRDLASDAEPHLPQFPFETCMVCTFQHSRTHFAMNPKTALQRLSDESVILVRYLDEGRGGSGSLSASEWVHSLF